MLPPTYLPFITFRTGFLVNYNIAPHNVLFVAAYMSIHIGINFQVTASANAAASPWMFTVHVEDGTRGESVASLISRFHWRVSQFWLSSARMAKRCANQIYSKSQLWRSVKVDYVFTQYLFTMPSM